MSDITLDLGEHDLEILNGDLVIISEVADATAQRLKIRLLFFKGEWFLNTTYGIPYFQRVLRKGVNKRQVDSIFRQTILETEGVLSIISFNSTFNNATREYSLTFSCKSESGQIITITI